ncbi:hypothetical protein V1387_09995 [Allomuricauda taeanensis]|uniref:hypothetical protein n=1 Tax=Flagellimonas taeanensis TaxID=1005926 RepID=UPI002E7C453C|nr:hypothetical protein [Allomuricauda taeanensis]MEE1963016.1 hypothetical protein [Allomuricauda taeanensis]
MRRSIKFLTVLLLIFGCANEFNTFQDITDRGGYIVFTEEPDLSFNILKLDTEVFSATLSDPNGNAIGYTLTMKYGDVVVENVFQTSSFPATLEFSIAEILEAFNLTADDIGLSDRISFVAKVTTPDGVFDGRSPDFDFNNINQGGDTTDRLKYPGQHNAMEFSMSFYQPPGRKIRGTSFEEVPVGPDDAVYVRNGANDETLDLINGDNPPYVDYVAKGTGADDELGFDSEYIAITNISESSLGFSEERIGVTALLESFESYPDGVQGFHSEDADGAIRITFDTVEVPEGQNNSGISFQVFFGDTSWEELDGIHAYANITTDEGNDVLELISAYNNDVETLAGRWQEVNSGFIKGIRSYQLVIQIQSGATPEFFDLDNIIVYEPEED